MEQPLPESDHSDSGDDSQQTDPEAQPDGDGAG
jgi:hypothetical protein